MSFSIEIPESSFLRRCFRPPFVFVTIWAFCLKLAFWFDVNYFTNGLSNVLETTFYVLLLALIYTNKPVHSVIQHARPASIVICVSVIVAAIAAQVAKNSAVTYPLLQWDMYSVTRPLPLEYYDIEGITSTGEIVRLPVATLVPTNPRAFVPALGSLAQRAATADEAEAVESLSTLDASLAAIGYLANRRTSGDQVVTVLLVIQEITPAGDPGSKTILHSTDLPRSVETSLIDVD